MLLATFYHVDGDINVDLSGMPTHANGLLSICIHCLIVVVVAAAAATVVVVVDILSFVICSTLVKLSNRLLFLCSFTLRSKWRIEILDYAFNRTLDVQCYPLFNLSLFYKNIDKHKCLE